MQTTLGLQEDVIEQLAFDPRVGSDDIAVAVKEGVVTLHGRVTSLPQKWLVEAVVKRVKGVRALVDELVVDLPARHVRNDTGIGLSIERRFETNSIVPRGITLIVRDCYVTLQGEAEWHYQAQEAASEARRVTGVKGVANAIVIKGAVRPDPAEVTRQIHAALQRLADMDAKNVYVTVSDSCVKLSGTARSWAEHDNATQAAWSVPGVTHVDNAISVHPW
ncbi:MAG: BON domain-containing protein [Candidatus Eremiobacteraeota bacterium]|nr:BON domain-containing protein [Candidatus Eremiobacteraeota bacterium]